jgi:hypothetical protein
MHSNQTRITQLELKNAVSGVHLAPDGAMVPIMSCSLHSVCLSSGLLLMSHPDIPRRFVLPKHPKSGLVSCWHTMQHDLLI